MTRAAKDADIDAPEGWAYETGSTEVVVAVFDTGIDYPHPDIKNNLWINHAEADGQDGADDDGNGYVDDVYGYDTCGEDEDPWDRPWAWHTLWRRLIAAQGNNELAKQRESPGERRIMSLRVGVSECEEIKLGNVLQSALSTFWS